jgi:hypothetical protein
VLSHWWEEITDIKIENFNSRNELILAESRAIMNENPKYNKHHKNKKEYLEIDNIVNEFSDLKHTVIHNLSKKLLYSQVEASSLLCISTTSLKKLKDANEIVGTKIGKHTFYYIWDLIDFCEVNGKHE